MALAVERGQITHERAPHPMSWGLREWYVLSLLMGTYFVLGQGYEYLDLIRKQGLTRCPATTARCST